MFPDERQAEGYVRERENSAKVVKYRAFQPEDGSNPRVLLFNQVGRTFYELSLDYEPDADRIRRELKQSAWLKLTAAERDAIGWLKGP